MLLAAAGCGDGDGGAQQAPPTTNDPRDVIGDEIDPSSPSAVESVADPGPGEALRAFVEAARSKDMRAMFALLSPEAKSRAGPTFAEFEERAGSDFLETVGGYDEGYEIAVSARTSEVTGVAAVDGRYIDPFTNVRGFEAFAAGAVKVGGKWLLEVLPPGALQLVSPDTQVASDRPVVVVGVEGSAPIIDVGIWIDGRQYPSPTDAASESRLSLLAQPTESIGSGSHTLVAYASLAGVGTTIPIANAWTFSSP